jgi:CHAD domain-containing protein
VVCQDRRGRTILSLKAVPLEIEAKYTVADPAVFSALVELQALGGYVLRSTGERHVIDHYMDTPRRDVLRGGYACRLREGRVHDRWLLTVKGLGKAEGAVHQREEHESEIPPNAPPDDWPPGPAREIATRLSEGQPLTELFTIRQHRVGRAVEKDDRAVGELSLDTVEVDIGGRRKVSREIEIELGSTGTIDDLRAIGATLQPYKLKAQSKSKFERALARLDDAPAKAAAKGKKALGVRADESLAEAGRKILRFHCERMLANEEGTLEGKDIEALHRMRVATRRQRAAFRIVAPYFRRKAIRKFREELRTAAGYLGAVRDLDVLIEAAKGYQASLGAAAAGPLEPLLDEWWRKRSAARDDLLVYLRGVDYQAFKESYRVFLSSVGAGVKDVAPDALPEPHLVRHTLSAEIWSHYGRVRAYDTVLGWASVETIHALRIEAKRLRYLLEFFREVLRPGVADAIEDVVALQDHTGELHDVDVKIGLLRHFLIHSARASVNPAVAVAVNGYLKVKEARLRALRRSLNRPWRRVAGDRFRSVLARAATAL